MAAVSSTVNRAKRVLQVNITPRCILTTGADSFARDLRDVASQSQRLKASGEVSRVVVVIDGAGASECLSACLKALRDLFSLEDCSLLDDVSTILLINADDTLKAAWSVAKLVDPARKYASLVRVLD